MFGIIAKLAKLATGASSSACAVFFLDEPKCPKSLTK